MPHRPSGFTMTELLVVVSILSVIVTASIVGAVNVSRRASYERARKDIQDLMSGIELARINSGKRLGGNHQNTFNITRSNCSSCECRVERGATDAATDAQCWSNYVAAINDINAAAGETVINGFPRDPWGSPYLINENEGENPSGTNCTGWCCSDTVGSAGPNRQTTSGHDNDDIVRNLQPLCRPIEGFHHEDQN